MDAPALKLGLEGPADQLLRTRLDLFSSTALTEMRSQEGPAVLLVRNDDLSDLGRHQQGIVFRGRKHPSTDLSSLALGRRRIPLVEGSYSSAGQLLNSLRTLFRNAISSSESNIYVVSSSEELFKRLWWGATGDVESSGAVQYSIATTGGRRSSDKLGIPMAVREVPAGLTRLWAGESDAARRFQGLLAGAAESDANVLIVGEPGCRRGLAARAIHEFGSRCSGPFVTLDCSAVREPQLSAELFGPGRRDADEPGRREGLWESARHGTLYLREVGFMPLHSQRDLSSAMKAGRGEAGPRVLASSSRILHPAGSLVGFDEELYFLIRELLLRVPPLRERDHDLRILAEEVLDRMAGEPKKPISGGLLEQFRHEKWPGNEAQLESVLGELRSLFGAKGMTLQRWMALRDSERSESSEIDRHWLPNLRFLRGVEEILGTVSFGLRADLKDRNPPQAVAVETAENLGRRSLEIESLCRAAPRIANPQFLARVEDFWLQLVGMAEQLRAGDCDRVSREWLAEGEPELDALVLAVSREIREAQKTFSPLRS